LVKGKKGKMKKKYPNFLMSRLSVLKSEITSHKTEYLLLVAILFFSAFLRLYRLDKLLGFWYDQGRDALVIWDLIHYKRFFLIGPVTGIEGIFLGPFYYYLLAPFYWLGRGSPVFVAAFLSWLTVGAIFLIYYLGTKIYNRKVGLISAFLYGFSYNLVTFSRWLANPNPLPFFTLSALIFLLRFMKGNKLSLVIASFIIGLCLQLEAASAVWFLPATFFILVWQRKKSGGLRNLFFAGFAFFLTLLPQIIFNWRHQGILVDAFKKFLVLDRSFKLSFVKVLKLRLLTYNDVFIGKIFPEAGYFRLVTLIILLAGVFFFRKKIFSAGGKMLAIWLFLPLVGFIFYQGNHGYIWDYYFTGVIPAFIIFLAAILWQLYEKNTITKIIVGLFLLTFLFVNVKNLKNYLRNGIGIKLEAQLKAIDWIYADAKNEDFNYDAYVPPQIYYSYSYLFRWYGKEKFGREPNSNLVKNLYTLSEPDGENPQFLAAWLERQDTIGKIVKDYFWGDITVQKRERLNLN